MRLEFYENWLNPRGMRSGRIGPASLAAVLSFLRQEGEPYTLVTQCAGEYAARWTYDGLSGVQRSMIGALPVALRAHVAMHLARKVVQHSYHGSHAVSRLRCGEGTLTLRRSIFCVVREPFEWPLCGFYSAALSKLLTFMNVNGSAKIGSCQGVGDAACVIAVRIQTNP
jgi:hypothetical protein